MKLLYIWLLPILFISSAFVFKGQPQVDQRLLYNHGEEIYTIYQYRKDYYKFLLYELDHGYELLDAGSVDASKSIKSIKHIQSKGGDSFKMSELDDLSTFNFMKYNFEREKERDVYYSLKKGEILKFTALKVLWKQFDESGLNNKS